MAILGGEPRTGRAKHRAYRAEPGPADTDISYAIRAANYWGDRFEVSNLAEDETAREAWHEHIRSLQKSRIITVTATKESP